MSRVFMLSFQANYRCGRSGVCCSSGWPIPVERAADAGLRDLLSRRAIALDATVGGPDASPTRLLREVPGLDDEHASLLGQDERGRCLFLEEAGGAASPPLEPPRGYAEVNSAAPLPPLAGGAEAPPREPPRGHAEVNSAAPLPSQPRGGASPWMPLGFSSPQRSDGLRAACAVQRQHGAGALPTACRLFPRVCLLEPRGVSIALSHYCPTAAALLLRDDVPLAIVRDPPAFAADGPWEGLDARAALPPLLRPDALLDWDSHADWEAHVITTLGRADLMPEEALDRLAGQTERARAWRHVDGPLDVWLRAAQASDAHEVDARRRLQGLPSGPAGDLVLFARALAAVPESARSLLRGTSDVPSDAGVLADVDARFVAPAWAKFAGPVRRYLAAHAFASWSAHQGRGLRTRMLALDVALAVLRVQAARLCRAAARRLERALFIEAARASDLLLLHLASREDLHASLSACEGVRA